MPGLANQILDFVTNIAPDSNPDRLVVTLRKNPPLFFQRADPFVDTFSRILLRRSQRDRPTYMAFAAESRAIKDISIPIVTFVRSIKGEAGWDKQIELSASHGLHHLRSAHPAFSDLHRLFAKALNSKLLLYVGIDSRGNITAAELADDKLTETMALSIGPCLAGQPSPSDPIEESVANALFAGFWADNCANVSPTTTCIPFRYVPMGCQTRASQICRDMITAGYTPTKNWVYKKTTNFDVASENSPCCNVIWTWHCAPKLEVTTSSGTQWWVFDPSVFSSGPVLETDWLAIFPTGDFDVAATTDADVYVRWSDGTCQRDPGYAQTDIDLADLRDALEVQVTNDGPPPYAKCTSRGP